MKYEPVEVPPILIVEMQTESNIRLRYQEMEVFTVKFSYRQAVEALKNNMPHSSIILSGGGTSMRQKGGPTLTREFFHFARGTPLLAINSGMHEMAGVLGGTLVEDYWRGPMPVNFYLDTSTIFEGFPEEIDDVWFDHRDTVPYSFPGLPWKIPRSKRLNQRPLVSPGFKKAAVTLSEEIILDDGENTTSQEEEETLRRFPKRQIAMIVENKLRWIGASFNPEVEQNFAPPRKFPVGKMLLANFARLAGHRIHGLILQENEDDLSEERRGEVRHDLKNYFTTPE